MILLKKWILRIVAGLLLLLVALFITAPANLLESQLTSKVTGLQTQGVSGGFWSGQFQQVYYQGIALKQLSWNISILSLLSGKIGADITINDSLFQGALSIEKGLSETVKLSKVNAHQSVVELAKYLPALRQLHPQGELVWEDVSLSFTGKNFDLASGVIQWQNAALNIQGDRLSLGTIFLTLNTDKGDILINIHDQQSELDIKGVLRFNGDRQYQFQVNLSEQLPANISSAVRLMTRPDGKGRLTFSFSGKL